MKKGVLFIVFFVSVSAVFGQIQEKLGVKSVIGASASQRDNLNYQLTQTRNGVNGTFTIKSVGVQVGLPYMGVTNVPQTNNPAQNYRTDLGFPWGIRYRYSTFSEDAFTVSKGYYTDKVSINWGIKNNTGLITDFVIYRSTDITGSSPDWGNPIATLSSSARSYDDVNTDGGKLYRYKILARGVESIQNIYSSYIIGIGYRNPTAIITGNVSFSAGNPVKNVLISATPTGSTLNFGSSLRIPSTTNVAVNRLHKVLTDSLTLQAWAKPENNFNNDAITLYEIRSNVGQSKYFKVKLGVVNNRTTLTLTIEEPNLGDHNITLSDYIPNGEVDNKGADVLVPISNVNGTFTHFTAVLRNNVIPEFYINGRLITAAYAAQMNTILANNATSGTTPPTVVFTSSNIATRLNTSPSGYPQSWTQFNLGGGKTAYLDEFRVWETALTPSQILTDYRRYLKGNEAFLHTYITGNEGTGSYAYDLSATGFSFHGNDAKLDDATSFGKIIPTNTQLGILGVTDQYGNFVISAVPYTGNGNSYTLVPSLGKHKFNPTQQLTYAGVGSTVINNVNFKDISSFTFKGIAVYDSRGVFPTTSDPAIRGDIKENEAYNAYTVGNRKYQKGEYWAYKNAAGGIDSLRRYAVIPVPGAYINIDNTLAIDANNVPILTDINGRFTVQVPIGDHAISVFKSGHNFSLEGRYPARTSSVINGEKVYNNTYQNFFQDQDEPITFIDTTKVTVVGRVVGGTAQSDQIIGFGDRGKKVYTYVDAEGVTKSTNYTSINNIGVAKLTLGYIPTGASSVTPEYKTSFETNAETGEFRVKLLPLNYQLSQNDLVFKSGQNPGNRPLLDADKTINFTAINGFQTPTFTQGNIKGEPYQEVLKFAYMANPTFNVLSQSSESSIVSGSKTYTIAADQVTPVYRQFGNYQVQIQGQESYYNYDKSLTNPVVSTVPVTGGSIIATNNLALENSETTEVSPTDPSILVYSFKGGMPNTDAGSGYKRTINLLYRLNGVDNPLTGYKTEGILLGGESDGSQTFVTAGPQLPDFVLRDPPGSGSSATIEKGSSLSFTKTASAAASIAGSDSKTLNNGVTILTTVLAGPAVKVEVENAKSVGIGFSQSSTTGAEVTNTYSFNQSISTSSDAGWDGSDADLYIGYSANQYYGTYNDLNVDSVANASDPIKVVSTGGSTVSRVYPKIKKAVYFSDGPQKTFFIYSQGSIINDLIPKYQDFIDQIDAGTLTENQGGVLSRKSYVNSINLWRKIIQNNEKQKYLAFNDRDKLKASLYANIDALKNPLTNSLSANGQRLKDLLNKSFYENISFDAGVGDFTKSYSIERVGSNSISYDVEVSAEFNNVISGKVNDTGFEMATGWSNTAGAGVSSGSENATSTTVSYTLNDTDAGNLLSVDVINSFDGNGPIFITKGGETSCPYEGAELSHFYNPTHPNVTDPKSFITDLLDSDRLPLSVATVALEKPEIKVVSANVSGVYEGRNAEFVLKLRNTSTVNKDATFLLVVDQTTNPDNALINIEPNGTFINIPAGQTVTYTMTLKKVKSDQFDYRNVKVSLQSLCDGNASSSTFVSANFIPSCSSVSVISPSNNWLMNRNTAYDGSATKPLNIKLGDYNTSFASFQKINLEYRLKGTPNWTGLRTYFKNDADLATARTGGDNNVELIAGNQLNFAWDIAGIGLSDGTYEIRARSTCYNNTFYESPTITGSVNLSAPLVFGTPTPTNGILGLGNDISVRFNEPIKTNGTVTKFEFLVQKNQLPSSHDVSLSFNGLSNTATISKPFITTGDLSIEFWLKNASPSGTSTLLNQSGGLKVELIDNVLKYTLGGQSISATILNDGNFNHYTLSYNASIPKLSIIENDRELSSTTSPNPITILNFTNASPIVLGGSPFKGNIHDLRMWSKAITRDQSVANMNVALTGNENGILGFWPLNEGNGTVAKDLARYKNLDIANANWDIFPKGTAYDFTGKNCLVTNSNTFSKVIISKEMDATLTFWMKTAQANATILSNGKGDSTDVVESNQYRNKWALNTNATGGLELAAEGKTYAFGNLKVNDDSWHHVALSLTRNGGLQLYVDGNQLGSYSTTNLGAFASSKLYIGARGQNTTTPSIDRYFIGQVDELCLWNMARTADQIKADRYFEVNYMSNGLLFYSNFNKPSVANSNGPKYYYPQDAFMQVSDYLIPSIAPSPVIVQTGLLVNLDPSQTSSYPGTGVLWSNLGSGGATYNATLQNGPTFNSANGGSFAFNGTNQGTQIPRGIIQDDFTLSTWFKTASTAGNLGQWWGGMALIDGDWPSNANDYGLSIAQGKLMFGVGNSDVTITSPNTYNDNNWHHVLATRTKSTGSIVLYVDGVQVASGTGNTNTLNQPGQLFIANWNNNSRYFQGSLSAIHIYSAALSASQAQQNYTALNGRFSVQTSSGGGSSSAGSFTDVTPAIKPFRPTESIVLNPVINSDQIVLVPDISNWASIEGKVAYITVSNLNDMYDNRQVSPVTWSAYINKNPVKMFVEGQGEIANLVRTTDSLLTFPITLVNQGGLQQPYSFNAPTWLNLSSYSGTLEPNKSLTVMATVDMNLAPGNYNNLISLATNYGVDKKVQLNLRVLMKEPKVAFSSANFTQSMNIVGQIKVDGIFDNDLYDKVYAVAQGANGVELRGKAGLSYDRTLDAYTLYLTVYSNVVSGENISFFIWDANKGNFLEASLNGAVTVPFIADRVTGSFSTPAIFENTAIAGQFVGLQPGWTWVSFNVNDPRFNSLNSLTSDMNLSTSDLIQSNAPALFDSYQFYSLGSASNGWSGGITSSGGITTNKMYKIKISKGGELKLKGVAVDLSTWSFNLQTGWNWLPYVANKNIPIGDALASLSPSEGDLIKSQNLFAIYSSTARAWKGSLTYLNQSEGYMMNVAKAQIFTYPTYINRINNSVALKDILGPQVTSVKTAFLKIADKESPVISPDYTRFANTMNAVVKLPEGFNELYFYNEAGELRGDAKTMLVDGQELAFITLYGDKLEKLTAHIGSINGTQSTSKRFDFSPDVILGSIAKPVLIELENQDVFVFPNPFQDELKIEVNTPEKAEAKISIYNLASSHTLFEKSFTVEVGSSVLKMQPNIPVGAYLIKVQVGEKVVVKKIMRD
jgi:hypothetical protein